VSKAFNSKFFSGTVVHARSQPAKHEFIYPVAWIALDIDECRQLNQSITGFSYNKFNLSSIHDADYLNKNNGTIRAKVESLLAERKVSTKAHKIILITTPKLLGWAFNPVSFYYIYDETGKIFCYLAEVNNTYEERTLYFFDVHDAIESLEHGHRFKVDKHFHVSPFYDETGHYDVFFGNLTDQLEIKFNLHRPNEKPFIARMWGNGSSITNTNYIFKILRFGLRMALTLPRIYWQALKIILIRKLKPNKKPNPLTPMETQYTTTLRSEPYTWYHKICMALTKPVLRKLKVGQLRFIYPDGQIEYYGDAGSSYIGEIFIKNFNFFSRLVHSGGIGFGEGYVEGDWTTPDLAKVMKVILDNDRHMHESKFNYMRPVRWLHRISHWYRRNSKNNSKKNISDHYDLGNEMFSLFLDPTMAYSSALYDKPDQDLHSAQLNKLHTILNKAQIQPGDSVLEIGCGWGELSAIAAKEYGASVTGITLSKEQAAIASQKMKDRGIDSHVQIQIRDYRDVQGEYDKVVSVEMIEAVGSEYLGSFFKTIDRVLSPNGICVLQVIAYPDCYYKEYLGRQDWIQKHIFPGSHLPSLASLTEAMANNSNLVIDHIENRAIDYSITLREWRTIFNTKREQLAAAGYDDRFQRAWNFYLASCEAEFETRWLSLYQIVLTRPNNRLFKSEVDQRRSHKQEDSKYIH
jgi:cyclopropane-fatty-acyl-phospholipid synthase